MIFSSSIQKFLHLVMESINKRVDGRVSEAYPENVEVKLRRCGEFLHNRHIKDNIPKVLVLPA